MNSFTELKFDPALIDGLVAGKKAGLAVNKPGVDLLEFGLGVVSRRLAKDPLRYLDYGPWWWSLKIALVARDYHYGDGSDSVVAAEYCGRNDLETMVLADQFRTEWLQSAQVGTNNFRLSEDGPDYILYDEDMAKRVPRNIASVVVRGVSAISQNVDSVLDGVLTGPVLTGFRHDAQGAIKALQQAGGGVAVAALHHPDIGDIDLRWGETTDNPRQKGHGLSKLIQWHPEVLHDLQKFMSSLEIHQRERTKITMKGRGNKKAAIRIDLEGGSGHWLLTAYLKKGVFDGVRSAADHTFELEPFLATSSTEDAFIVGFEADSVNLT